MFNKRKYTKSLQIQKYIQQSLNNGKFFTANQLSKYIKDKYNKQYSRSIISRHLGEMGYSYKNVKGNTNTHENKIIKINQQKQSKQNLLPCEENLFNNQEYYNDNQSNNQKKFEFLVNDNINYMKKSQIYSKTMIKLIQNQQQIIYLHQIFFKVDIIQSNKSKSKHYKFSRINQISSSDKKIQLQSQSQSPCYITLLLVSTCNQIYYYRFQHGNFTYKQYYNSLQSILIQIKQFSLNNFNINKTIQIQAQIQQKYQKYQQKYQKQQKQKKIKKQQKQQKQQKQLKEQQQQFKYEQLQLSTISKQQQIYLFQQDQSIDKDNDQISIMNGLNIHQIWGNENNMNENNEKNNIIRIQQYNNNNNDINNFNDDNNNNDNNNLNNDDNNQNNDDKDINIIKQNIIQLSNNCNKLRLRFIILNYSFLINNPNSLTTLLPSHSSIYSLLLSHNTIPLYYPSIQFNILQLWYNKYLYNNLHNEQLYENIDEFINDLEKNIEKYAYQIKQVYEKVIKKINQINQNQTIDKENYQYNQNELIQKCQNYL